MHTEQLLIWIKKQFPKELLFSIRQGVLVLMIAALAPEVHAGEVQNTSDSGPGSLRQVVADAQPGEGVFFSQALSGARIVLGGTPILIDKRLDIGAITLPRGITIDGNGLSRIFTLTTNAVVNLAWLNLTGGRATGTNVASELGGAILNEGQLNIYHTTIYGNEARRGGAIYNGAANGSSSSNRARLLLHNSTVSENKAILGGGLANMGGGYTLEHVTIAANTTYTGQLAGGLALAGHSGGVHSISPVETSHSNSIVAGNFSPDGYDINSQANFYSDGMNIVGRIFRGLDPATTISVVDPKLLPLGLYGGNTPTMPPMATSPAIDAAPGGTPSDQRRFNRPMNGGYDIGAVEVGRAATVANTNDSGPGSLRQAVVDVNNSGATNRILFAPALSGATINISLPLEIRGGGFMDGSTLATPVTIKGMGTSRLVTLDEAGETVSISSVILSGGMAGAGDGGAILNPSAALSLYRVVITNCSATRGGAIYMSRGVGHPTALQADSCIFINNSAAEGGALYNANAVVTLDSTSIVGNSANRGGGIYSDTDLGGVNTTLKNCTLALNAANRHGGGILNVDGLTSLLQCTVVSNSAPSEGGGGIGSLGNGATQTRLQGTIVSRNRSHDLELAVVADIVSFISSGYNLVGSGYGTTAFEAPGDVRGILNPQLLGLADNGGQILTMHPAVNSPVVNAAGPNDPGGTDARGYDRFAGGALDIGAVEAVFGPQVPYLAVEQRTNLLEIVYDLIDPELPLLAVRFDFSRDGGNTWVTATNATGAFGPSVERGSRKVIIWNALQDLGPVFNTQVRVRLTVTGNGAEPTVVSSDNVSVDTRPRTVTVKGRVLEITGNPISGATVTIGALPGVSTGSDGKFSVPNVPRAGGTLTVSKATYSSQTREISTIAGITEHVVDDIQLTRLAFQVSDITRDIEGIYLGGDFPFEVRATAHIDWGGRTRGHVNFYLGNTLLQRVNGPTGNETTITFNTANRTSGLLPYSKVELRAEAVAANAEVSLPAKDALEFVGVQWLDALPFQVHQVGGLEPRYTFFAKFPPIDPSFIDLGLFGNLGVDLTANLGMVYAPRSGEWELWIGNPSNVRSSWRPRGLEANPSGFVIASAKLSLDTRGFASGQASPLGLGFRQLNVESTLNFNQRLGELCLTDFIPGSAASVRSLGNVVSSMGYDFNSLQCIRFDLDVSGALRVAATASSGDLEFQDGSFTAGGTLSGYYKPDLGRFVVLLAKLSGGVAITLGVPQFEYRNTTLTAVAELTAISKIPFLPSFGFGPHKWVLLDESFPSASRAMAVTSSRVLDSTPVTKTLATSAALQSAAVAQPELTLAQNVSNTTSHALATFLSQSMLIYARQSTPGVQELVWSRFDGASWSAPLPIPGATSVAILQPTLEYDGRGNCLAVWQEFRSTPAAGASVAAVTAQLELKWARFSDGSWTAPQFLTDNTLYDGEPQLAGILADGDVLLFWRQSTPGDSFALNGALMVQRWHSSTRSWGPVSADNTYAGTADFSCGAGGGRVAVAWSQDADGNFADSSDTEIFYRVYESNLTGPVTRFTADVISDRSPRVAVGGNAQVFMAWLRGGQLAFSKHFGTPSILDTGADDLAMSDLRIAANFQNHAVLLWQEPFGRGSDAKYRVYDGAAGLWGEPAYLWRDEDAEHDIRLTLSFDGKLGLLYLKDRLVSTTQELTAEDANGGTVTLTVSNVTETASVDLMWALRTFAPNLTVSNLVVSEDNFIPGNTISLSATVQNTGDLAVQNPAVRFSFLPENGSPEIIISNRVLTGWITPQSSAMFNATWVLPPNIGRGRLAAKADPANAVAESDESAQDNEKSVLVGGTDLLVTLKRKVIYPNRSARVTVSVFNGGSPASPASTLVLRRNDGSIIATASAPSVAPGDTIDLAIDLAAGFQQTVYEVYTVGIDPFTVNDSELSNNESGFSIYLPAEQLDPFPVTNGLQLRLTAQAGTSTTVDGAPVAAWIDQQNGHIFTNANPTRPTYVANSGGGKPALDFSRNSGFIGSFSSTAGGTITDAVVFVVGRFSGYTHPASDASFWYSIDSSTGGSEPSLGRQQRTGAGPDALMHDRGQPAQSIFSGANIVEDPAGAFTLYTTWFRSAANGGGVAALVNGVLASLTNISGSANSGYEADPSKTRIGLSTANGSGLDGMIRELVIFNRPLSIPEIAAVQDYLGRQASQATRVAILTQPANTAACPGGSANLFVTTSSTNVTYQWQRRLRGDGSFQNISGASADTYTTPILTPGDDGTAYRVLISGSGTNLTSAEATLAVLSVTALTASYDFNSGLPLQTAIYGHAYVDTNTGVLELNANAGGQNGAFLTADLAPGITVHGFTAAFDARVEAGSSPPADGFSFNWSPDLPNDIYPVGEEGEGSAFRLTFDVWDSGGGEAPAVEVQWAGNLVARRSVPISFIARGARFFHVEVRLTPDGYLDMTLDCESIFTRMPVPGFTPQKGARFGFGSRTGGAWESHGIDNLILELYSDAAEDLPRITNIDRQPPSGLLIKGTGEIGQNYSIEASTDLQTWAWRASVVADGEGVWQLLEPSINTPPYRFYRLLAAPQFPRGLVTWYRGEGNARDSFGTNHGSLQGGLAFAAGQNGQAFRFDGDASMLIGGSPIAVPWTASFFINRQDSPDISALLLSDNLTALKLEQASLTRQVGFTQYGVADHYFTHIAPANTWQHLTFVAVASRTDLYVNGRIVETNPANVKLPMHRLGRHENGSDRLKGLVDEVTIFNRALTPAEVGQLYNASRGP